MSMFRSYALALVLVWGAFEGIALSYRPLAAAWLATDPHEADYLESLRESSKFGCLTVLQRRPDVAVVGDSHSYSAFDFVALEQALGRRLGACAMGGADFESLPLMLELVRDAGARQVVIGVSPRMFWRSPSSRAQHVEHERVIEQARTNTLNFWRRIATAAVRGRPPFPRSASAEAARASNEEPRLLALDEQALAAAASRLAAPSMEQWQRRVAQAELVDPQEAAGLVCDAVRAQGLSAVAMPLPESPILVSLYPAAIVDHYRDVQRALTACGVTVVAPRGPDAQVHNRDFANRALAPSYAYARWGEPVDAQTRMSLMDLDHMNGVGARRFTRAAAPALAEALR